MVMAVIQRRIKISQVRRLLEKRLSGTTNGAKHKDVRLQLSASSAKKPNAGGGIGGGSRKSTSACRFPPLLPTLSSSMIDIPSTSSTAAGTVMGNNYPSLDSAPATAPVQNNNTAETSSAYYSNAAMGSEDDAMLLRQTTSVECHNGGGDTGIGSDYDEEVFITSTTATAMAVAMARPQVGVAKGGASTPPVLEAGIGEGVEKEYGVIGRIEEDEEESGEVGGLQSGSPSPSPSTSSLSAEEIFL